MHSCSQVIGVEGGQKGMTGKPRPVLMEKKNKRDCKGDKTQDVRLIFFVDHLEVDKVCEFEANSVYFLAFVDPMDGCS